MQLRESHGWANPFCSNTGAIIQLQYTITRVSPDLTAFLLPGTFGGGPTLFCDLAASADGKGIRRYFARDAGTCPDVCSVANRDWRNQGGVAADESAFTDARHVLVHALVVAGDHPCANVGAGADFGISQIGQMAGFCALAQLRFFGFDKIADMRFLANLAAGAEMRKGANFRAIGDARRRKTGR